MGFAAIVEPLGREKISINKQEKIIRTRNALLNPVNTSWAVCTNSDNSAVIVPGVDRQIRPFHRSWPAGICVLSSRLNSARPSALPPLGNPPWWPAIP